MGENKEEQKGEGVYTIIAADDGSLPAKTDEAKQMMLKQRKMFEMDSYYKYIKNFTYRTEFISISLEQANALQVNCFISYTNQFIAENNNYTNFFVLKLYFRGIELNEAKYLDEQKEFENLKQSICFDEAYF